MKYDPQNESLAPQVEPNTLDEPLFSATGGVDLLPCVVLDCLLCSSCDGLNHVERGLADFDGGSGVPCVLIAGAASLEVEEGGETEAQVDTTPLFAA